MGGDDDVEVGAVELGGADERDSARRLGGGFFELVRDVFDEMS